MADMHVLDGDGSRYRVVMHFPMPAGKNSVNVPWSTALVESAGLNEDGTPATPTTMLQSINAAEKARIEAGRVHEHSGEFLVESGGTTKLALRAALRHFYAREKTGVTAALQIKLRYFGHTESEV